jgi:hypothetical protein
VILRPRRLRHYRPPGTQRTPSGLSGTQRSSESNSETIADGLRGRMWVCFGALLEQGSTAVAIDLKDVLLVDREAANSLRV